MTNVTLFSWVGSSEREDGTPYLDSERHGYNVAIMPRGEAPTDENIIYTAIATEDDFSIQLDQLGNPMTEGDWDFYVQDEDSDGRRSIWSPTPAQFTWVTANPKPPTGLSAS